METKETSISAYVRGPKYMKLKSVLEGLAKACFVKLEITGIEGGFFNESIFFSASGEESSVKRFTDLITSYTN